MDIETSPNLSWTWGIYEQNVIEKEKSWYILCWAAKWLDRKPIMSSALPDFKKMYKNNPEDDSAVLLDLWQLFDEADIIIGHNSDAFDIKKTNARFLAHGMTPPSPYKTIDTVKMARKTFKFDSNKLDHLGEELGLGRKIKHDGFSMWKGCMNGVDKDWKNMVKYNKMDVTLLEKVYLALRAWSTTHPNLNLLQNTTHACPICGVDALQKRGFAYTKVNKYQRYQCVGEEGCGGWSSGERIKLNKVTIN